MVQIEDISNRILYDNQKAENNFLSMTNACVSHEIRNPLNAMIAYNIEKENLYKELRGMRDKVPEESKEQFVRINDKLSAGLKVQESSANLMRFLIQGFLDYSQIKSGKLRINNKLFNVREAIENVMCIQRKKAED